MRAPDTTIADAGPGRQACVALVALAACLWSAGAVAEDLGWNGWQTDDGGVVAWGIKESDAFLSFTCSRTKGTIDFWNDAELPGDFLKDPFVRVKVDEAEFKFRAEAHFSEMNDRYEGTAILAGNEPFLTAVASGNRMQIYDLINDRYYSNPIPLKGTGRLFATYLSGCLND